MGEPAFAESVVRLHHRIEVVLVNTDGHAHEHVLRALDDFVVDLEQVAALQGFESEVIVVEVPVVDDLGIEEFRVVSDDLDHVVCHEGGVLTRDGVDIRVEVFHRLSKGLLGSFVEVGYCDSARQARVVRVRYGVRRCHFRSEVIQFSRGHPVVNSLNDAHGHFGRIDRFVQLVTEFFDPCGDFIELYRFCAAVALDY